MKVYKYGLGRPTEETKTIVNQQMWLAHRYQNELIRIERDRRDQIRAAQQSFTSVAILTAEIQQRTDAIGAITEQIKKRRQKDRKRTKVSPELKDKQKKLRAERKALGEELRAAKAQERTALRILYKDIEEKAHGAHLAARANFSGQGLYWGTYLLVEKAIEQSREDLGKNMSPEDDPKFRRWRGSGLIGTQIQKGMDAEDIFDPNGTLIQVDPVDEGAWLHPKRSERRKLMRTRLRLRVASTEKRKPIWADFALYMHRPLPEKSRVKRANIVIEKIGETLRYSLHLTIDDSSTKIVPPPNRAKAVGLDVGWRKVDEGMRVATWHGSDGEHGYLVLPNHIMSSLHKVHDLGSIRDMRRDAMAPLLILWLKNNRHPKWLKEETSHIEKWKAQSRFRRLWRKWRDNRFKGDEEIFAMLNAWGLKDKHLLDWEANQRDKTKARRKEIYRVFAAELAEKYEWLGVENFNLTETNQKTAVEDDDTNPTELIYSQKTGAVSILRSCLENAFRSRAGAVVTVPAPDTTRECHACGTINIWDQAKVLERRCSACGVVWDQDENAAKNILSQTMKLVASGQAAKQSPEAKSGRWQRRKEAKEDLSQKDNQATGNA